MSERSERVWRTVRAGVPVAFCVLSVAVVVTQALICSGLVSAIRNSADGPFREVVDNPGADFTRATGLAWPQGAKVVSVGDDHGGMMGDGEFHVVFDTDEATLKKWLASPCPWQPRKWQRGPVPTEIGFHCRFGTDGVAAIRIDGGPSKYVGDRELEQLLRSQTIWYAAKERCCESLRWHNGHLLVIDCATNRVWLSVWDF
jgi:hypothetical protein